MKNSASPVIAIDGFSSCGKSSFAREIAAFTGYTYIDSGAMYRALTWFCLENNILRNKNIDKNLLLNSLEDISISFHKNKLTGNSEIFLNGKLAEENIRTIEVSENVSLISQIKEVREKMAGLQRKMGEKKSIVMDGRDIGTVVFPDADLKIFMTADPHVRALRRYNEMKQKGMSVSLDEIEKNINERDFLDTNRTDSPLVKASDAVLLDNTTMSPAEQMEWFKKIFSEI